MLILESWCCLLL